MSRQVLSWHDSIQDSGLILTVQCSVTSSRDRTEVNKIKLDNILDFNRVNTILESSGSFNKMSGQKFNVRMGMKSKTEI